jgi:hypothetical protein
MLITNMPLQGYAHSEYDLFSALVLHRLRNQVKLLQGLPIPYYEYLSEHLRNTLANIDRYHWSRKWGFKWFV